MTSAVPATPSWSQVLLTMEFDLSSTKTICGLVGATARSVSPHQSTPSSPLSPSSLASPLSLSSPSLESPPTEVMPGPGSSQRASGPCGSSHAASSTAAATSATRVPTGAYVNRW